MQRLQHRKKITWYLPANFCQRVMRSDILSPLPPPTYSWSPRLTQHHSLPQLSQVAPAMLLSLHQLVVWDNSRDWALPATNLNMSRLFARVFNLCTPRLILRSWIPKQRMETDGFSLATLVFLNARKTWAPQLWRLTSLLTLMPAWLIPATWLGELWQLWLRLTAHKCGGVLTATGMQAPQLSQALWELVLLCQLITQIV